MWFQSNTPIWDLQSPYKACVSTWTLNKGTKKSHYDQVHTLWEVKVASLSATAIDKDNFVLTHHTLRKVCAISLTLFSTGVGHYGPQRPKTVCRFYRVRARLTKIHDFVPFNNWQVQEKLFLESFKFFYGKWSIQNFRGVLGHVAKIEKFKKIYFFAGNLTFSGWICILQVLSLLLRYITVLLLKIWNFEYFGLENFQFWPSWFDSP